MSIGQVLTGVLGEQAELVAAEHVCNAIADDAEHQGVLVRIAGRLDCDVARAREVLKAVADAVHEERL
jgi:hypothetical protein